MYPRHPSTNSLGDPDGQFQNVSGRFPSRIQSPQVTVQDVPNYEFVGNQLPGKGFFPSQYGYQPSNFGRTTEFAFQQQQSAQTQQQQFQAHQLSAEQSVQDQMQLEPHFPETSYSALLHGPDTPPFEPEPSWDTPIAETENHVAGGTNAFYQGFRNNYTYNNEKVQAADPQPGFYTEPSLHVPGGGPGPVFHPNVSQTLEHSNAGSHLSSEVNEEMTMFPTFSQKLQPKDLFSAQTTNQIIDQYPTSKIRNQAHDIRFRQPRTWNTQNQNCPDMDMMETSFQGFPTSEHNSMQTHQYSTSIDMRNVTPSFSHYQHAENTIPEEGRLKHQQDWNMAAREISTEGIANSAWNSLQTPKLYPDPGNGVSTTANNKIWNTNAPQNGHYFLQADASTGMHMGPSSMQTGWQASHAGALNSAATMTGTNFHSYQEGLYTAGIPRTRQDSGPNNISKSFPTSLEAYEEIQGSWKSHTTSSETNGIENSCSSLNGDMNVRNWVEAMNSTPMKPGLIDQQHPMSIQQQSYKRLSPIGNMHPQHAPSKPVQYPLTSQHASNFMKVPSIKSAPNLTDTGMSSYGKDEELEGPQAKRQKEFSEFSSAPSYRANLPSSSYLPQNINFGSGPPKDIQQPGLTVRSNASELQELGQNFNPNMQPSLDSHVSEADFEHGSSVERKQIIQRSTMHASSSFVRQRVIMSEPSTSLASGQVIDGSLMPPIPSSAGMLHGTYAPGNAGRNHRQLTLDIGNSPIMQDQTRADLVKHPFRDRTKVGNSPDLPTAWKPSALHHTLKVPDQVRSSFGVEEPSHPASAGVQSDELQSNVRKSNSGSFYGEDSTVFSNPNIGHRNFEGESNVQSKQPSNIEEIEAATSNAQVKLQMQRPFPLSSSSPLNGFKPSILPVQNDRQDWSHFGLSNAMVPQTAAYQGKFSRPPMEMSRPVLKQPHQLQTESDDKSLHTEAYRGTWTPKLSETAALAGCRVKHETVKPLQNHWNSLAASSAAGTYQQQNTPFSDVGSHSMSAKPGYPLTIRDVTRKPNAEAVNFELQQPGGRYSRPLNGEQLISSQLFPSQNPSRGLPLSRLQDQCENQLVNHSLRLEYATMKDGEPTSHQKTTQSQRQLPIVKSDSVIIHPRKRKNLIPWHLAARQPRGQIISISKAELMWATLTNRLSEKNIEEVHNSSLSRARTRLKSTTQLMQQLVLPDISVLTSGNGPNDNECVMYNLSKVALGEACRLMMNNGRELELGQKGAENKTMTVHGQMKTLSVTREAAIVRIVERFTERMKNLEKEFSRLDGSLLGLDLKSKTQDLDTFSIVNRLAKTYGTGFIDSPESVNQENSQDYIPGTRRPLPQRYVIAVPMPKTLPENVRCLSL